MLNVPCKYSGSMGMLSLLYKLLANAPPLGRTFPIIAHCLLCRHMWLLIFAKNLTFLWVTSHLRKLKLQNFVAHGTTNKSCFNLALSSCPIFNLKGSSIPTISELLCYSLGSCHARLKEGRCSNFILHDCSFGLNGPCQVQEYIQHAYWATYIQRHN